MSAGTPVYTISVFGPDRTTLVGNHDATWPELEHLFTTVRRTSETCDEWMSMKGSDGADAVKAQFGCLVGGPCRGDRRSTDSIPERSLVTLDVDEPSARMVDEVRELGCSAIIHPTHTPGRWRVIIPLTRPVGRDEYRRLVAALSLRVSGVDPASGKIAQVMYLPSTPADDSRTTTVFEAAPLDPSSVVRAAASEPDRPGSDQPPLEQRSDRRLLSAAVVELAQTREGGRNEALNRQAFKMAAAGALDENAREVLRRTALSIGLGVEETDRTLDSAVRSGDRAYEGRVGEVLSLFGDMSSTPAAAVSGPGRPVLIASRSLGSTPPAGPAEELWAGRIPMGALTLLSGRGGAGKSLLSFWLAAKVSCGELDGALCGVPSPVAVFQSEDAWATSTAPRLRAAGADPDRTLQPVASEAAVQVGRRPGVFVPMLPAELDDVEAYIEASGARLVVMDVLTGMFAGGLSTDDQLDVRRVVGGLQSVATRTGAAIVAVNHLRKGGEGVSGEDVAGSHEFRDSVQSLWLASYDSDMQRTVMRQDKYNLGVLGTAFSYRIESVPLDDGSWAPCITDVRDEPMVRSSNGRVSEDAVVARLLGEWLDSQFEGHDRVASEDVVQFLKGLKDAGLRVGLLSNLMDRCGWVCRMTGAGLVWMRGIGR